MGMVTRIIELVCNIVMLVVEVAVGAYYIKVWCVVAGGSGSGSGSWGRKRSGVRLCGGWWLY
jgi:hypothetical protein